MPEADPVTQAVVIYLRGHADEPGYRQALQGVRLWIDEELAGLYAAAPLWAGQPPDCRECE